MAGKETETGSGRSGETSKAEQDEDEENKIDFELLKRQLSTNSTDLSLSSADLLSNNNQELWPLRLNTLFIDHYILGEVIGHGSYAEVRECIDTRDLARYAIKIVNKAYLRRQAPRALANQQQEINLLKRLNHPNVISLKECLLKGPKIYIVLEFCTFVLSDLLSKQADNKLCQPLARNVFRQLITGINYLHSLGIIHRDIKPQNLLLTNCGQVKLIDFGVSQTLSMWSGEDRCSNYEGSPLFQAPEVVAGELSYHGYKVDVWSAGVTLYLMLFGDYPFMDEALLGLYDKILSQELRVPREELGDSALVVVDLLEWMLDKVYSRRPTTDQVLEHPWLRLADCANGSCEKSVIVDLEIESSIYHGTVGCASLNARQEQEESGANEQQRMKGDIYRSMSVLPYLHSYHFPQLSTVKVRSSSPSARTSSISSSSTISSTPSSATRSPTPSMASTRSPRSPDSAVLSDPHQVLDETPIEWGTERQYNLMKVPIIRANRTRHGARRVRRCKGRGTRRHQRPSSA